MKPGDRFVAQVISREGLNYRITTDISPEPAAEHVGITVIRAEVDFSTDDLLAYEFEVTVLCIGGLVATGTLKHNGYFPYCDLDLDKDSIWPDLNGCESRIRCAGSAQIAYLKHILNQ